MIMGDKNLEESYAWGPKGLSFPLRGSPARSLLHLTHSLIHRMFLSVTEAALSGSSLESLENAKPSAATTG